MPTLGGGLKKVEASNNKITKIFRKNFEKCKNLEYLNLTRNLIDNIEEGSFSNAQNLVSI